MNTHDFILYVFFAAFIGGWAGSVFGRIRRKR
jgi:Trk-type K+ transport system membrane component